MRIFRNLSEINYDKNSVVTLGTFDGLHLGHQKIIKSVIEKSADYNCRSVLITFDPHPRSVVSPGYKMDLLSTLDEKIGILETLGLQNVLIIKFTKEFSQQSPEDFIKKYLADGIGLKEVVIGYDHHFGKGRDGNIELMQQAGKKFGFDVSVVSGCTVDDTIISSTKIRKLIAAGQVVMAAKMLGRPYSFDGVVIHGDDRGKKLGFPTANLNPVDLHKILPAIGIYAVECIIDGVKNYGLLNVGKRPTFHQSGEVIPEVYLFDFDKNIYDKTVTVKVIEKIRDEKKFNSAEELIHQIKKDEKAGAEILSKLINPG